MLKLFLKKALKISFLGRHLLLAAFSIVLGVFYWIFFIPSDYFLIPIQIDTYWNIPLIEMEIANKKHKVEFNLGTRYLTLSSKDLSEIDKKFCETFPNFDVTGHNYESTIYEISGVKIHDFFLPKMKVQEESPEFLANSVLEGDMEKLVYTGRLGREVFEGKNFLLDFPQSKIILCKNFKDLAKDHYKLEDFIKTSFFFDKRIGMCFQIETDTGMKTLLLDTGASMCLVRPSNGEDELSTEISHKLPVWRSQKFILGDYDFGERKFYLFKLHSGWDMIDGFLGMDFLKEHAIYLDTEHSVAYIAKSATSTL